MIPSDPAHSLRKTFRELLSSTNSATCTIWITRLPFGTRWTRCCQTSRRKRRGCEGMEPPWTCRQHLSVDPFGLHDDAQRATATFFQQRLFATLSDVIPTMFFMNSQTQGQWLKRKAGELIRAQARSWALVSRLLASWRALSSASRRSCRSFGSSTMGFCASACFASRARS